MNTQNETTDQAETPDAGKSSASGLENAADSREAPGNDRQEVVVAKNITLSSAEYEELKTNAAKAGEHWDRLLRQAAELENYKRRIARERQDAAKFANLAILEKLIPVMDNFDMALAAANQSQAASIESMRTGVALICAQLRGILAEAGLEEIDAANKPFDPLWHEAVSQQDSSDAPEGHVLQQLRKGYKLRDRLIRPAGVVVARKPAA